MGNDVKVSIILPVYNCEKYLDECIRSVFRQTIKEWELIIINDGSNDNSLAIIRKYANEDKRIKVLNLVENRRLVFCLNLGIKEANSDFIARMDADDIMYPTRLEKQLEIMFRFPEVGVVGSNVNIINENGDIISRWTYPESDDELKKTLNKKSPFAHPAVMFRKSLFAGMDQVYRDIYPSCEDYDLWIRLHKRTNFFSIREPLIEYRLHKDQITSKKIKGVYKDVIKLVIRSVIQQRMSVRALLYLYKPLFYIVSPSWLIKYVKLHSK